MSAQKVAASPATAQVRCRMPMLIHKRFLILDPRGRIVELDWMFLTRSRWCKMAGFSTSPAWRACGIGPFVLAFRVWFGTA
jgi:hypothetical protein